MNLEGPLQTLLTLIICSGLLAVLFNYEKFFKKNKKKTAQAESASDRGAEIAAAIAAVKSHTNAL